MPDEAVTVAEHRTTKLSKEISAFLGSKGITSFVFAFHDPDADTNGYGFADELEALKLLRDTEDSIFYGE